MYRHPSLITSALMLLLQSGPWARLGLNVPVSHPFPLSAQASFAREQDHVVETRSRLCDLLFCRPEFDIHAGPSFSNLDTKANDAALAGLLIRKVGECHLSLSFEDACNLLVEFEEFGIKKVSNAQSQQMLARFDETLAGLGRLDLRKRYLCIECRSLILGINHPVEAAGILADLSRQAAFFSPSIGQVAMVHAINLYTRAKREIAAVQLFDEGKAIFGVINPTEYNAGYWNRRKVQATGVGLNGNTMDYIEPHFAWVF